MGLNYKATSDLLLSFFSRVKITYLHLHCLLHPRWHADITDFVSQAFNTPSIRSLKTEKYKDE